MNTEELKKLFEDHLRITTKDFGDHSTRVIYVSGAKYSINILWPLVEALEEAYMSLADCSSRVKAPEPYMLAQIKKSFTDLEQKLKGG